jgi:uncharacterized protein
MAADDEDEEAGPERTCVASRVVRPIHELIRFVAGPDDILTPDLKGRLPGRGVWVTGERALLEEAVRRKAFARGLKRPVVAPDGLADLVDRLLAADARQSLAIANKAGLVVCGFAKVEAQLARGRVAALVSASDGGEDGRRKLMQAARRHAEGGPTPYAVSLLPGHELDLALGRENAIHAALLAGAAGDAFLARCARLERFRSGASRGTRPDAE